MNSSNTIVKYLDRLKEFNDSYTIKDMLEELRKENQKIYNKAWFDEQVKFYGDISKSASEQKIFKADNKWTKGVPVIKKGVYHELSPMLQQRFAYADKWKDAYAMDWLGLKDMEKAWASPKIMKSVESFKEFWNNSIFKHFDDESIVLFGCSVEDNSFTFLAWRSKSVKEPEVYTYIEGNENKYKDLESFLKHITS